MKKQLDHVIPENVSGYSIYPSEQVIATKAHHFFILDQPVTGDAPKQFIRLYEFGVARKSNPHKWPRHIAKTGQKWYPIESITEHLLNRIGQTLGLKMADSQIRFISGQLRFLSRYFLKSNQQLIHGAEMYYGYFENDSAFVDEIETMDEARNLLTLQITKKAVHKFFPSECETIMHHLIKMVLFDAWVGNNDRHFFNWGVVRHVSDLHVPYFSPIYDTARGLFWNFSEENIVSLLSDAKTIDQKIEKYTKNSRPKIGWEGDININHFQLIRRIYENEFCITKSEIRTLFSDDSLDSCNKMIDNEFDGLMSPKRKDLIKRLLAQRYNKLKEVVK